MLVDFGIERHRLTVRRLELFGRLLVQGHAGGTGRPFEHLLRARVIDKDLPYQFRRKREEVLAAFQVGLQPAKPQV